MNRLPTHLIHLKTNESFRRYDQVAQVQRRALVFFWITQHRSPILF